VGGGGGMVDDVDQEDADPDAGTQMAGSYPSVTADPS